MNGPFVKVVLFVVAIVAAFVYIGETLTEISGSGSVAVIGGEISEAAGEAIFLGKGKCYTCHSFGSEGSAVRCPNLGVFGEKFGEPVGVRAAHRRADEGLTAVEYIVESIYNPNAYVVEGYPKDLMKPINRPPIALSDDEIASVILYLLAKSEVEMEEGTAADIHTAQEPFASGAVEVAASGGEFDVPEGDSVEGRFAFQELGCFQCHEVEGVSFVEGYRGGIGPELTAIGAIQTPSYILESIINPGKVIVADPPGVEPGGEGSYRSGEGITKMPEFHDVMTVRQLLDISAFLATLDGKDENTALYGG